MDWKKQRIRDWPVGQSRRLFWQIISFYPIPADTETIAPLDNLPGELVQILPAKVGIAEVTIKIGHREYDPVTVLRAVGQVIGYQGRQDIGRHFLRTNLLKSLRQFRW